jgi:hypothetical protein
MIDGMRPIEEADGAPRCCCFGRTHAGFLCRSFPEVTGARDRRIMR